MEIHVQADPLRPNEQLAQWGYILVFVVDTFSVDFLLFGAHGPLGT